jgi:hypothetical protein
MIFFFAFFLVTPASPTATSAPISIPARPRAASSASSSSSAEGGQVSVFFCFVFFPLDDWMIGD